MNGTAPYNCVPKWPHMNGTAPYNCVPKWPHMKGTAPYNCVPKWPHMKGTAPYNCVPKWPHMKGTAPYNCVPKWPHMKGSILLVPDYVGYFLFFFFLIPKVKYLAQICLAHHAKNSDLIPWDKAFIGELGIARR